MEMLSSLETYFAARAHLVRLLGYMGDPGFADPIFANVALGAEGAQDALGVKAVLMQGAEIGPAPEPRLSEIQRDHEERIKNERAGKGHYTDKDLVRLAEDPVGFTHGAGAHPGGAVATSGGKAPSGE
jgi:hypothetical protein